MLKNTLIKLKNTLEGFNNKLDEAEEPVSELEVTPLVFTQTAAQREKIF